MKTIPNFTNYSIDKVGNVINNTTQKELKQSLQKDGYKVVYLYDNNKKRTVPVRIHILLAVTYMNHKTDGHKIVINHIDLDKTNNYLANLELVSQRENANHLHTKSTSKYRGVSFRNDVSKWMSQIFINNKSVYLGNFNNEKDASLMYNKALDNLDKYKGNAKEFRNLLKK
jgi:hypothetical protein